MLFINVHSSEVSSSPELILEKMMALKRYGDVPILILDSDKIPLNSDAHEKYVIGEISKSSAASSLEKIFDCYKAKYITALSSSERVMPGFIRAVNARSEIVSALIVAPGSGVKILENCLLKSDLPNFKNHEIYFRIFSLAHELAHALGANEPQADRMAGILLRRLFDKAALPIIRMQADIRAISVMDAIRSLPNLNAEEAISKYGWPMVEVNDSVAGLSQQDIDEMTDNEFRVELMREYSHFVPDADILSEAIDRASLRISDGREVESIHATAEISLRLQNALRVIGCGAALMALSERFACATRRLAIGENAYNQHDFFEVDSARSWMFDNLASSLKLA